MASLQEIMIETYREGREDAVKEALSRRVEVKKTGKGSKVERHNAEFGTVEEEALAALKLDRKSNRNMVGDFVGGPEEDPEEASEPTGGDVFSVFGAAKELLMNKDRASFY